MGKEPYSETSVEAVSKLAINPQEAIDWPLKRALHTCRAVPVCRSQRTWRSHAAPGGAGLHHVCFCLYQWASWQTLSFGHSEAWESSNHIVAWWPLL